MYEGIRHIQYYLRETRSTLVQTSVNISIIFSPPFPRVWAQTFWLKIPHYTPAPSASQIIIYIWGYWSDYTCILFSENKIHCIIHCIIQNLYEVVPSYTVYFFLYFFFCIIHVFYFNGNIWGIFYITVWYVYNTNFILGCTVLSLPPANISTVKIER